MKFFTEIVLSAVIDAVCSRTVAGKQWFYNYLKHVDDNSLNNVKIISSNVPFKFGDNRKLYPAMKATIPAQIAQTNCSIEVEIIDADIPLLLSKSSLQKADSVLDLKNDKVKMFNKNVDFQLSSNGHYAVNILPNNISNFQETEQIR